MYEGLRLPRWLKHLAQIFDGLPAGRAGRPNTQSEVADAATGALAVFLTQPASFVADQRARQLTQGRNNAERLFEMQALPSDHPIRDRLDRVSRQYLQALDRQVVQAVDDADGLTGYGSFGRHHWVGVDGTPYFASKKIHCPPCRPRVLSTGQTHYWPSGVTPGLVQPGWSQVLALEPEFSVPTDTHTCPNA